MCCDFCLLPGEPTGKKSRKEVMCTGLVVSTTAHFLGCGGSKLSFLTTIPTEFIIVFKRKEGSVLFNDALNTFYLRLYGVGHMVKDHLDSELGNPLLPHGLLFPNSSKGSFICTIPQTG